LSNKVLGGIGGKHTHVVFHFDKDGFLYFNDVRKFGWMEVHLTKEVENHRLIGKLGPEPLKDLTLVLFEKLVRSSAKPIKNLIMDQEKIAGVGNIYANDALFLAQIHPARKANSLTDKEVKKLLESIEKVLKKGIEKGGASERSYVTPDGSEGSYQDVSLIYGKEGKPCVFCGTKIEKIQLGGRGTYYCPKCQKGNE
jgi:formamidopyrimidine-DNA glycosylase